MTTIERWFAKNTFNSIQFDDLKHLLKLKSQQGITISLGLPTLNEEKTIGNIISQVKQALVKEVPLLDEVVLIDGQSSDHTCEIAQSYDIPIYRHQDVLSQYGSFSGKGEALWKSLYVLKGDLVVWVDTDTENFHPRFVYGVLGPLLQESHLVYCKGFYRRPIRLGNTLMEIGGGRVTELTARPILNCFFPQLSGIAQPLSGEYAARRQAIESLPFSCGYGVEIGLLIDVFKHYGLDTMAQTYLRRRVHYNQDLVSLSKMAFTILQVAMQRLEGYHSIELLEELNQTIRLIRYDKEDNFYLESEEIENLERPPMITIPEYRLMHGLPPT